MFTACASQDYALYSSHAISDFLYEKGLENIYFTVQLYYCVHACVHRSQLSECLLHVLFTDFSQIQKLRWVYKLLNSQRLVSFPDRIFRTRQKIGLVNCSLPRNHYSHIGNAKLVTTRKGKVGAPLQVMLQMFILQKIIHYNTMQSPPHSHVVVLQHLVE